MRELTIQRTKSFVGRFGIFKVYIEDGEAGDLKINGVSCRLLGTLKNGETKTFSIEENAAKLFVIAGKMSKSFCSELILLPAGIEPLSFVGQSRFNLFAGNAFRFDGDPSPETLKNRKDSTRLGAVIFITSFLLAFIAGWIVGMSLGSGL